MSSEKRAQELWTMGQVTRYCYAIRNSEGELVATTARAAGETNARLVAAAPRMRREVERAAILFEQCAKDLEGVLPHTANALRERARGNRALLAGIDGVYAPTEIKDSGDQQSHQEGQ